LGGKGLKFFEALAEINWLQRNIVELQVMLRIPSENSKCLGQLKEAYQLLRKDNFGGLLFINFLFLVFHCTLAHFLYLKKAT
jgi:hypothetical protein